MNENTNVIDPIILDTTEAPAKMWREIVRRKLDDLNEDELRAMFFFILHLKK